MDPNALVYVIGRKLGIKRAGMRAEEEVVEEEDGKVVGRV